MLFSDKFTFNNWILWGRYVKKSEILLANNMIDFVGSDIHKAKHISHFDDQIKITQIKALEKSIDNNKLFK